MNMDKTRGVNPRKIAAATLLLASAVLLAYAYFHSKTSASIPGWIPVNEPLQSAIASLSDGRMAGLEGSVESSTESSTSPSVEPSAGPSVERSAESSPESKLPSPRATVGSSAEIAKETVAPNAGEASPGTHPPEEDDPPLSAPGLIDLNEASQSQLETLPGIGPSKAKAILSYREKLGGFRSLDQLLEVKGIGQKVYERISVLVQISARK
jgi:competence protein ComEA